MVKLKIMINFRIPKYIKKKSKILWISVLFLIIFFNITIYTNLFSNNSYLQPKNNPKMSWFWATLDLTNPSEVNNSRFTHAEFISVKGHVYNKIDKTNKSGISVAIEIDDIVDMSYTDITDGWGRFNINYMIDPLLDIYSNHKIKKHP